MFSALRLGGQGVTRLNVPHLLYCSVILKYNNQAH